MAKPLRSENPQPQDTQFKHFGVLNSGAQSKTSLFTSITVNVLLALIIVIIGAAAKKVVEDKRVKEAVYIPVKAEKPPDPPKPPPKMPPPPKIPPKPLPDPPKIKIPDPPKLPDPPKPVEVKIPKPPTPVVTVAPPKMVVAAAAPKVVAVNMPAVSASIKNNDAHPSAVALGRPDNPIAVSNRPSPTAVALGNQGMAGMPPTNGGRGPVSAVTLGGNGSTRGSIGGTGVRAVEGVKLGGVTNGSGNKPGNGNYSTGPTQVALGHAPTPPAASTVVTKTPSTKAPTVVYKPAPVYTEEARAQHIEGAVRVHIRVTASGQVEVLSVVSGLGHGLDQSAMQVCRNMKFKPAVDANGNAVDWDGNVTVTFQLA